MAEKSFRQRFKEIKKQLEENKRLIEELSKNSEDKKNKPHSKVKGQSKLGNMDMVYDAETGLWKSYSVYKDDEE